MVEASFSRDGYAVLRGLLAPAEVIAIRDEVDRLLSSAHDAACERPNNTLVPLRWNSAVVDLFLRADARRPAGGRAGARLRRIAAALDADDLRWISGYISVKDAHSPPLWWHQDWWCWDHPVSFRRSAAQAALLCYLSDTDSGNGALRVLPRSQRESVPVHAVLPEAHSDDSTALDPSHAAMTDQPGQVTLDLRAGDAAVLDYRLLHGTHANGSQLRRDCILLTFAPCWAGLPADIRGHLISHPALPMPGESPPESLAALLPSYDGPCIDLPLNRNAPADLALPVGGR